MAESVSEVLVGLGLRPETVAKFLEDVKSHVDTAGSKDIKINLSSNVAQEAAKTQIALKETGDVGEAAGKSISDSFTSAAGVLGKVSAVLGILSGTLIALIGAASSEAAQDEQALKRLNATFGESTSAAEAFTNQLTEANKQLTGSAVQEALSQFGLLGGALGLSAEESLSMSKNLTSLAANIAKVRGLNFTEVVEGLNKAFLKGGKAALRMGLDLEDTRLKAEAVRLGFLNVGGSLADLSNQQETLAKFNVLMEQAGTFAERAAEAPQTFSESLTALRSQISELLSDIGGGINQTLQPWIDKITEVVSSMREWVQEHPNVGNALLALTALLTLAASATATLAVGLIAIVKLGAAFTALSATIASSTAGMFVFNTLIGALVSSAAATAGAIGLVGAAILAAVAVGAGIGTLIDHFVGISDAMAKVTAEEERLIIQMERMEKANLSAADASLTLTKEELEKSRTMKLTSKQLDTLLIDTQIYAKELKLLASSEQEAAHFLEEYNRFLLEGLTPFQARAQALSQDVRLLALHEQALEGNTTNQTEYNKLVAEASDVTLVSLGIKQQSVEATVAETEAVRDFAKETVDAAKAAKDAEIDLQNQRVKSTKTIEDDIALLKERAAAENRKLTGNFDAQRGVDKKLAIDILSLQEEEARKSAEKIAEDQQKAIEGTKKANEKAMDEAVKAEDALLEARAKATKALDDDIELLFKREEAELANAKTEEQRAAITIKFNNQFKALEQELAKQKIEDEKKIQDAVEESGKGAVDAENRLASARASATDTLQDDIDLMHVRQAEELKLAKSEEERANIKRKFLADEKKLVEDLVRKQAADVASRSKSLQDFIGQVNNTTLRRTGRGSEADVKDTSKGLQDQIKNITDDTHLKEFKKTAEEAFGNTLADGAEKAKEAAKGVREAEKALKDANRAADPKARAAAKTQLADALAEQQTVQKQNVAAEQLAQEEFKKTIKLAEEQAKKEAAKKKELADLAEEQADPAAGKAGGADAAGAVANAQDAVQQDAFKAGVDALQAQIETVLGAINEAAAGVAEVFPTITSAIEDMAIAQQTFAESFQDFGDVVTAKLQETADTFNVVAGRLDEQAAALADLAIGDALREDADNQGL